MIHRSASKTPTRRGQLITPFGVGALVTNQKGVSMICTSLDHWFQGDGLDISEFEDRRDGRLISRLGIDHVRIPPDFRDPGRTLDDSTKNLGLKVPAFRFPQWHFCPKCKKMIHLPPTVRGQRRCRDCGTKHGDRWYGPPLYQLRFVAACDQGHLQDFPWQEWVHRSPSPDCGGTLEFQSSGGGTLSSVSVKCRKCGSRRHLGGITRAYESGDETHLSDQLYDGGRFLCSGRKPWTGSSEEHDCDRPLRGALRNASNLYFADTFSSILIPPDGGEDVDEIVHRLKGSTFSPTISLLRGNEDADLGEYASMLKSSNPGELGDYQENQIEKALRITVNDPGENGEDHSSGPESDGEDDRLAGGQGEVKYRWEEFSALREPRDSEMLTIRESKLETYGHIVQRHFDRVTLVDRLRETRVLTGFTRLDPDLESLERGREMMWKDCPPPGAPQNWLPGSITHGEGIFLEFDQGRLEEWETRKDVIRRTELLRSRYENSRFYDEEKEITPRFVLTHTFSHLLINRLVFECGYSTAALRERLYVSTEDDTSMAGVLIYTAAGDSDGTMGGLVRMGQPGYLEPVVESALSEAEWCSADPICMEAAEQGGQGPESLNLAACHNCALTPETSCEEFNHFLDRGTAVGFADSSSKNAYFDWHDMKA